MSVPLRRLRYRVTSAALLTVVFLAVVAATGILTRTSWRPLAFREPDRLVLFLHVTKSDPEPWPLDTLRAVVRITPEVSALAWFSADGGGKATHQGRDLTARVTAVSANFFSVLGVPSVFRGAPGTAVVTRAFARSIAPDGRAIGETIQVDGRSLTIIGIVERDQGYPSAAQIWYTNDAATSWWMPLARLKGGLSYDDASNALTRAIQTVERDTRSRVPARSILGDARPAMEAEQRSLIAGIGLFAFIAVVNFGLVGVGQARRRLKEFSIRVAVGATHAQVKRELLIEQGAIVGGAACLTAVIVGGASLAGGESLVALTALPPSVAATLGAALLAVLAAAALPVGVVRVGGDAQALRQVSARGSRFEQRWNQGFVAIQFAVTAFLVVAGGVAITSLEKLRDARYGFDPADKFIGAVAFETPPLQSDAGAIDGVSRFVARLQARLPQANVAAWGRTGRALNGGPVQYDVLPRPQGWTPPKTMTAPPWTSEDVTPNFFSALGLPVIAGRAFTADDDAGAEPVIILSETTARSVWGVRESIGKRMRFGGPDAEWRLVVGVAANALPVEQEAFLRQALRRGKTGGTGIAYRPLAQVVPQSWFATKYGINVLVAGTDGGNITAQARRALEETLPGEKYRYFGPAAEMLDGRGEVRRGAFARNLLVSFAALGFLLALVGTAVLIDEIVRTRTNEIGIRRALGAQSQSLVALVTRESMTAGVAGAMFGAFAGLRLGPVVAGWMRASVIVRIQGPAPIDYGLATATTLGLLLLIAAGCALRGMRAAALDPVVALRVE
jgi:putative ABC transport system permease protein